MQAFLEVWGEGSTWEEMCDAVSSYPARLKAPYAAEDQVRSCATPVEGSYMHQEEDRLWPLPAMSALC